MGFRLIINGTAVFFPSTDIIQIRPQQHTAIVKLWHRFHILPGISEGSQILHRSVIDISGNNLVVYFKIPAVRIGVHSMDNDGFSLAYINTVFGILAPVIRLDVIGPFSCQ